MENADKPPNPFNPGSPVDPSDFVGRVSELENFKQKLRQTAVGLLSSMSVIGSYGIGKTSFLQKCKTIAEEQNALVIYFSLNEAEELDKDTLAKMLISRVKEKVYEEFILKRVSKDVFEVLQRIRIKAEPFELSLASPEPTLFPNLQSALSASWKAIEGSKKAIVFLIDEATALEKKKADLMMYLRAVLEQLQVDKVPVMFVLAGKLSIMGPSGTGFSPIVRTFPPAELVNFTPDESKIFIEKKLKQVKLRMGAGVFDKVREVSEGHPYILSAYLYSAYDKVSTSESELTINHLQATDVDFVPRKLAPFFSRFYDTSGETICRQILTKMGSAQNGEVSLLELSKSLNRARNEVSPHLGTLIRDGAIIRVQRGKYRLFHHLLREYIRKINAHEKSN